jgi:ubiquinone/menaquinone biosynthesis C-methylase UbiE
MTYSYTDLLALFGIGGAHPGGLPLTRAILEELNITQNSNFLEVGCGTGQTTGHIMAKYPCHFFAIDSHPIMISKAKKRLQTLGLSGTLLEANVEKLPFADQTFDFVLSESVTAFTNIKESLSEYHRVLKQDGVLILIEMTEIQEMEENEIKELMQFYNLNQILNESNWLEVLEESGFHNVESTFISLEDLVFQDTDFTEFDISANTGPELFELLDQHEELTTKYREKLGFRIFLCKY